MPARFDHIAIAAEDLETGAAAVEAALGVPLQQGGEHALMGTHNRLLSLGPGEYLEVITINPRAPAPDRPRWFDLDRFQGRPRPNTWIAACDDLTGALAAAPRRSGQPIDFERNGLRWRMAVPDDGQLPFDSAFPALIEWQGSASAADRLTDLGCRLEQVILTHPDPQALQAALAPVIDDPRITIEPGAAKAIRAVIRTPHGLRELA
ncbi:VOC family protein [Rhodobacteraceae bacterium 2376]|uniref:VOC family protein n=1 Tax=Rhabdonatronobacter sediminivivens TaxID=2743469 RepID=A0A7Z0I276_9RHOB|nr:VOC family protein [Rhabdonatronobacter sediminivivens]NYS26591.1 VOC family protein [Rhabdonatronobacter sediminivivens]